MPRQKKFANNAAKQADYRQRMAILRTRAMKLWVLPASQAPRLKREIPWLCAIMKELETLRERIKREDEYAGIGRRWVEEKKRIQSEQDKLADQVAALECTKRRRGQRAQRQRERRQEDPAAEARRRAALPFGDRLAPSAQTAPTIAPNSGQIDPTDSTKPRQNYPTIGPRIGQDRDTISPKIAQNPAAPAAPRPAPADGHDGARDGAPDGRDGRDWLRYIGIPRKPIQPTAVSDSQRQSVPASAGDKSAALLARIKAHGYQVDERRGLVRYNSTEWISPTEWLAKMPGILD